MLKSLSKLFLRSPNEKFLNKCKKTVNAINLLEEEFEQLTDIELKEKTIFFREEIRNGKKLDDILIEVFAVVREASKRVLNMRHFDVQLIGGICLHNGNIAEMATGEGKTLVATLAAYLNALPGKGVHIITVNDYLVTRDAQWMGEVFRFLGLTVGCITHGISDWQRQQAYACDITYGANNEFGFDYLRDNMKFNNNEQVQRPFNFAIIDEVDSILIDEARTPLIISGPAEDNSELYKKVNKIIPKLSDEDFEIDEKSRTVTFTDHGNNKIEKLLLEHNLIIEESNLYDIENVNLVHHINQALRAHKLFQADKDYMIKDNQILIIDEFTGRALEGRRYSEGLHQALEAKENVLIKNENQTLASITYQNYFRLYPKLSGMAGTAATEAQEFMDIYRLGVIEIPTNQKKIRQDNDDEIYRTNSEKYDAIIKQIEESHKNKQPILVGTVSIEKSEQLSLLLKKKKVKHNVLNARYHEQEAHIIAQAGKPGAVTIATNMAGRGTDIKLGGSPEMLVQDLPSTLTDEQKKVEIAKINKQIEKDKKIVLEAGGLFVIGTERHESRRIDNQLRGRSGRQGDPGRSKFYLSLEDDLMRIFASDRMGNILYKLGLKDGEAIQHPMISRALEKAQQKVEARNFDIRKNLLRFDDVANDQRKVIYEQREEIMSSENLHNLVLEMAEQINEDLIEKFLPEKSYIQQWDLENLTIEILRIYGINLNCKELAQKEDIDQKEFLQVLNENAKKILNMKLSEYGEEILLVAEKRFLLLTLDGLWKDHLHSLDHLRQGISLRAYAQKDPLVEYKREAFNMFSEMLDNIRILAVQRIAYMQLNLHEDNSGHIYIGDGRSPQEMHENHEIEFNKKMGRNEACHCGSNLKYKHCHGKI